MLKILTLLKTNPIIQSHQIFDFKSGSDFYFIKAKAILIDSSVLFIREFISKEEIAYSYHWQTPENDLITRWDNSPHHKRIGTFPHHKHTPKLEESSAISFEDVLREISNILNYKF